jgi:hypothetical protein
MGIVDVVCFAARIIGSPATTITPTSRRTISAAIAGTRSFRPSVERYSMTTFPPPVHPRCCSSCRNASRRCRGSQGPAASRYAIIGTFAGCCGSAMSGAVLRRARVRTIVTMDRGALTQPVEIRMVQQSSELDCERDATSPDTLVSMRPSDAIPAPMRVAVMPLVGELPRRRSMSIDASSEPHRRFWCERRIRVLAVHATL